MPRNERKLIDDCFLHDKDRLRHEEAIKILRDRLSPVAEIDEVNLADAAGRIIAENIQAGKPVPSADNSAVDGYAFSASDYEAAGGFFPITARIQAGDLGHRSLPTGAAARIFTGAIMPENADTIAMQEDCETHEQDGAHFVVIPPGLEPGANMRKAGEDLKPDDDVAVPGDKLNPQQLAAIASTGRNRIEVYKPLRIALLSSGNELKRPGQPAETGEVYDSNHFLLRGLLRSLPVEITDLGILPDNYDVIETTLADTAGGHDLLISTGGASRGEADHVISALDAIGKRHLWQLAVKPGRPMTFGQIANTVFFGLPGNPVACFVCFCLYARPSILKLAGANWHEPKRFPLPANFEIPKKKPNRREFWRGQYEHLANGEVALSKFARDGSGLITGLRETDGLIEVPEAVTSVRRGDYLNFIPWSELGIY
jgi:molybdopterin molybdotransferase